MDGVRIGIQRLNGTMITGTLIFILSIVTIMACVTICLSLQHRIMMLSELYSRGISKPDAKELLKLHRKEVNDLFHKKFGAKETVDCLLETKIRSRSR